MLVVAHPNISVNHNIKLLLTKLYERFGTPLKDWDIKISRGILTGLNEAFIIGEDRRKEILDNCETADERERTDKIIRPILRGRDIKKDGYEWPGLYCILAYYGFHKVIDAYPSIYNHLLQYENALKQRGQVRYTSSGKPKIGAEYPGQHHWLELDNNPRKEYLDDFLQQKIMWSGVSSHFNFVLVDDGSIVNAPANFLTGKNLEYLQTFLNSQIMEWYYRSYATQLGESGIRFYVYDFLKLKIPLFTQERWAIIQGSTDLNQTVNTLYSLTEEEMNFISSSVKPND